MAQGEQKPLTPTSVIAEMTADEREKIERVMDGINGKRL